MMVDFFLISSWPSISTFSTMEDQRKGSNKSSYLWWKYIIDGDLSYWKSHQHFPSNIDHISEKLTWGPTWFSEDKTRNDPVLSARFAQIREAYDILGDEGQRAIYDSAGLQPLEFYQLFLGGKQVESPGVLRNLGYVYIYILNCLPWLLWGGEVFTFNDIIWKIKPANWNWWVSLWQDARCFFCDEQMRTDQFGQL